MSDDNTTPQTNNDEEKQNQEQTLETTQKEPEANVEKGSTLRAKLEKELAEKKKLEAQLKKYEEEQKLKKEEEAKKQGQFEELYKQKEEELTKYKSEIQSLKAKTQIQKDLSLASLNPEFEELITEKALSLAELEEGNVKNLSEIISNLKENYPSAFKKVAKGGVITPTNAGVDPNSNKLSMAEWTKITSSDERKRLREEGKAPY